METPRRAAVGAPSSLGHRTRTTALGFSLLTAPRKCQLREEKKGGGR